MPDHEKAGSMLYLEGSGQIMSFLINNPKSDGLAGCYMQEIVNNIQARIVKAVHIMEGLLGARLSALLGA